MPRRPSFAPSATTSTRVSVCSAASSRRNPSAVVSPETPAFTKRCGYPAARARSCSSAGYACAEDRPGPAVKLSPSTTTTGVTVGVPGVVGSEGLPAPHANDSAIARSHPMVAIDIVEFGGPEVLRVVERPQPEVGAEDVLIRVEAAGVNRPDIMQRLGKYPPPSGASDIPGLEVAGTIVAVAAGGRWQPGDRVCALVAGGGYAEYCVVPAVQCLPIPAGLDAIAAAAIPETFFTVWTNLFGRGGLRAGE